MLPILLVLLAGGADLARAFFVGIQIADAARQAALYAANNPNYTSTELATVAEENAGAGPLTCPVNDLSVPPQPRYTDTTLESGGLSPAPFYQPVVVTCALPMLTPFLPPSITIKTTATALVLP